MVDRNRLRKEGKQILTKDPRETKFFVKLIRQNFPKNICV